MTTAVENVSSAVRRYVAAVSGGAGTVPDVFDALARYLVGGLEPDEAVLRVACLRNAGPGGTTTAALVVLTDRAVLLAEEGAAGQRIALADLDGVQAVDVDQCPGLDLFHGGTTHRIVAAPVDGWNSDVVRTELQELVTTTTAIAGRARAVPPPAVPQQAVVPVSPFEPEPVRSGATGALEDIGYGKARFVGDAAPVGGIPLSRLFNSICYVIAGIALVVMSQLPGFPGGGSMALAIVIGLLAIAYGAKIALTRTSYWVSSWVYVLAFGSVAAMVGFLSQ
jgi:hypothetical protein